jgi:hypothetical protein
MNLVALQRGRGPDHASTNELCDRHIEAFRGVESPADQSLRKPCRLASSFLSWNRRSNFEYQSVSRSLRSPS